MIYLRWIQDNGLLAQNAGCCEPVQAKTNSKTQDGISGFSHEMF